MEDLDAKRLKDSLMEYEGRLEEMRQAAQKNLDTLDVIQRYTDKSAAGMQRLAEQSLEGVQRVTAESAGGLRRILETGTDNLNRLTEASGDDLNRTARESAEKIGQLSAAGEESMKRVAQECLDALKACTQSGAAQIDEAYARAESASEAVKRVEEAIEGQLAQMRELLKQSDDFTHRENVKVYRNVQAVVQEETKKQTETLGEQTEELVSRSDDLRRLGRGVKPLVAGALLLSAANLVLLILQIVGVF